ncbi:MAG: MaoC family dehydratase N-terminal domain-containing protein, partial [Dehalococcoidia bacterium]
MASLIPGETQELIGQRLSEPISNTITLAAGQRFAYAADDLNPIYFDEEAARAAGYRGCVIPPTYLGWAIGPFRPLTALRIDGLYGASGDVRRITLNVKRTMAAGDEWDFLAPIYGGDTITAETRLKSLAEKEGGSGPFVLQTT